MAGTGTSILLPVELLISNLLTIIKLLLESLSNLKIGSSGYKNVLNVIATLLKQVDNLAIAASKPFISEKQFAGVDRLFGKIEDQLLKVLLAMSRVKFGDLELNSKLLGELKVFEDKIKEILSNLKQLREVAKQSFLETDLGQAYSKIDAAASTRSLTQITSRMQTEVNKLLEILKKAEAAAQLYLTALQQANNIEALTSGKGLKDIMSANTFSQIFNKNNAFKTHGRTLLEDYLTLQFNLDSNFVHELIYSKTGPVVLAAFASLDEKLKEKLNTAKLNATNTMNSTSNSAAQVLEATAALAQRKAILEEVVQANQRVAQSEETHRTKLIEVNTAYNEWKNTLAANVSGMTRVKLLLQAGSATMEQMRQETLSTNVAFLLMERTQRQFQSIKMAITNFMGFTQVLNLTRRAIQSAMTHIRELDTVMNKIAIVTTMDTGDLWDLIGAYSDMAQKYGASIQGAYEVSLIYYQLGLQTSEVLTLTNETLKLAKISGLDYAATTDYMTTAIRGFKMEAQDASRVVDVYSNLAAHTAVSLEELAVAMSKTASSMESVGTTFEEASAMIGTMVAVTRESATNIGSAMKSIASRYGELTKDPTKLVDEEGEAMAFNKVDAALQSVGISMKTVDGQFRSFTEVIMELGEKWEQLDSTQLRYIATQFAGNRQQSRFLALVSNVDLLKSNLNYAEESEDTGTLLALKALDSIESKTEQVRVAYQLMYTSIGAEDIWKHMLDGAKDLINTLNGLPKLFGKLPIGAIGMIADIIKVIKDVAFTALGGINKLWDTLLPDKTIAAKGADIGKTIGDNIVKSITDSTPEVTNAVKNLVNTATDAGKVLANDHVSGPAAPKPTTPAASTTTLTQPVTTAPPMVTNIAMEAGQQLASVAAAEEQVAILQQLVANINATTEAEKEHTEAINATTEAYQNALALTSTQAPQFLLALNNSFLGISLENVSPDGMAKVLSDRITAAIQSVEGAAELGLVIGANIVLSLVLGLTLNAGAVPAAALQLANSIMESLRLTLNINSPSPTIIAMISTGVGKATTIGLESSVAHVKAAAELLGLVIPQALEKSLQDAAKTGAKIDFSQFFDTTTSLQLMEQLAQLLGVLLVDLTSSSHDLVLLFIQAHNIPTTKAETNKITDRITEIDTEIENLKRATEEKIQQILAPLKEALALEMHELKASLNKELDVFTLQKQAVLLELQNMEKRHANELAQLPRNRKGELTKEGLKLEAELLAKLAQEKAAMQQLIDESMKNINRERAKTEREHGYARNTLENKHSRQLTDARYGHNDEVNAVIDAQTRREDELEAEKKLLEHQLHYARFPEDSFTNAERNLIAEARAREDAAHKAAEEQAALLSAKDAIAAQRPAQIEVTQKAAETQRKIVEETPSSQQVIVTNTLSISLDVSHEASLEPIKLTITPDNQVPAAIESNKEKANETPVELPVEPKADIQNGLPPISGPGGFNARDIYNGAISPELLSDKMPSVQNTERTYTPLFMGQDAENAVLKEKLTLLENVQKAREQYSNGLIKQSERNAAIADAREVGFTDKLLSTQNIQGTIDNLKQLLGEVQSTAEQKVEIPVSTPNAETVVEQLTLVKDAAELVKEVQITPDNFVDEAAMQNTIERLHELWDTAYNDEEMRSHLAQLTGNPTLGMNNVIPDLGASLNSIINLNTGEEIDTSGISTLLEQLRTVGTISQETKDKLMELYNTRPTEEFVKAYGNATNTFAPVADANSHERPPLSPLPYIPPIDTSQQQAEIMALANQIVALKGNTEGWSHALEVSLRTMSPDELKAKLAELQLQLEGLKRNTEETGQAAEKTKHHFGSMSDNTQKTLSSLGAAMSMIAGLFDKTNEGGRVAAGSIMAVGGAIRIVATLMNEATRKNPWLALAMGIMAIVNGISLAIETDLERLERLTKEAEEASNKAKAAKAEYKSLDNSLKKLDELREKRYESEEATEEYQKAVDDLAEKFPALLAGFDAAGNVIIDTTNAEEILTEARKKSALATYDAAKKELDVAKENREKARKSYESATGGLASALDNLDYSNTSGRYFETFNRNKYVGTDDHNHSIATDPNWNLLATRGSGENGKFTDTEILLNLKALSGWSEMRGIKDFQFLWDFNYRDSTISDLLQQMANFAANANGKVSLEFRQVENLLRLQLQNAVDNAYTDVVKAANTLSEADVEDKDYTDKVLNVKKAIEAYKTAVGDYAPEEVINAFNDLETSVNEMNSAEQEFISMTRIYEGNKKAVVGAWLLSVKGNQEAWDILLKSSFASMLATETIVSQIDDKKFNGNYEVWEKDAAAQLAAKDTQENYAKKLSSILKDEELLKLFELMGFDTNNYTDQDIIDAFLIKDKDLIDAINTHYSEGIISRQNRLLSQLAAALGKPSDTEGNYDLAELESENKESWAQFYKDYYNLTKTNLTGNEEKVLKSMLEEYQKLSSEGYSQLAKIYGDNAIQIFNKIAKAPYDIQKTLWNLILENGIDTKTGLTKIMQTVSSNSELSLYLDTETLQQLIDNIITNVGLEIEMMMDDLLTNWETESKTLSKALSSGLTSKEASELIERAQSLGVKLGENNETEFNIETAFLWDGEKLTLTAEAWNSYWTKLQEATTNNITALLNDIDAANILLDLEDASFEKTDLERYKEVFTQMGFTEADWTKEEYWTKDENDDTILSQEGIDYLQTLTREKQKALDEYKIYYNQEIDALTRSMERERGIYKAAKDAHIMTIPELKTLARNNKAVGIDKTNKEALNQAYSTLISDILNLGLKNINLDNYKGIIDGTKTEIEAKLKGSYLDFVSQYVDFTGKSIEEINNTVLEAWQKDYSKYSTQAITNASFIDSSTFALGRNDLSSLMTLFGLDVRNYINQGFVEYDYALDQFHIKWGEINENDALVQGLKSLPGWSDILADGINEYLSNMRSLLEKAMSGESLTNAEMTDLTTWMGKQGLTGTLNTLITAEGVKLSSSSIEMIQLSDAFTQLLGFPEMLADTYTSYMKKIGDMLLKALLGEALSSAEIKELNQYAEELGFDPKQFMWLDTPEGKKLTQLSIIDFSSVAGASEHFADLVADAVDKFFDDLGALVIKGLQGSLSHADKTQLEEWITQYNETYKDNIKLTFSETADGIKASELSAIDLYYALSKVDSLQAKLVFDELNKSLSESNEHYKTMSGVMEHIAELNSKISNGPRQDGIARPELYSSNGNVNLDAHALHRISANRMRLAGYEDFIDDYATTYTSTEFSENGRIGINITPITNDGREILSSADFNDYISWLFDNADSAETILKLDSDIEHGGKNLVILAEEAADETETAAEVLKNHLESEADIIHENLAALADYYENLDKPSEARIKLYERELALAQEIYAIRSTTEDAGFSFMSNDIPGAQNNPLNYFGDWAKAIHTFNDALNSPSTFSSNGKTFQAGAIDYADWYNMITEMNNLASKGHEIEFAGETLDGSLEAAARLILKGAESLAVTDTGEIKVALSGMSLDFEQGADAFSGNVSNGIKSMAESLVKMLDSMIQLLETIVAMEELGDIDTKEDGIDIADILPEIKFDPNTKQINYIGEFSKGYAEWRQKMLDLLELKEGDEGFNKDLQDALKAINIEGFSLAEIINWDEIEFAGADTAVLQAYMAMLTAFSEAAKSGEYNLDSIIESVKTILAGTGYEGEIKIGDQSLIFSQGLTIVKLKDGTYTSEHVNQSFKTPEEAAQAEILAQSSSLVNNKKFTVDDTTELVTYEVKMDRVTYTVSVDPATNKAIWTDQDGNEFSSEYAAALHAYDKYKERTERGGIAGINVKSYEEWSVDINGRVIVGNVSITDEAKFQARTREQVEKLAQALANNNEQFIVDYAGEIGLEVEGVEFEEVRTQLAQMVGIEDKTMVVTVKADLAKKETEAILADINSIDTTDPNIQINLYADGVLSTLDSIASKLAYISSLKTLSITIDETHRINSIGGTEGDNQATGNVGRAKAQGTLMGELGPELVVSNGRYFVAGLNGAEFVDLADDAIVFNHLQTEQLLKNGMSNMRGHAVTNERNAVAFAAGNTGPAMASAKAALAALKQLRAQWQALAGLGAQDLAGAGGGGGGGGGGGKDAAFIKDLEKWYNWLQRIAVLEEKINYEEAKRNKYQSDMIAHGKEYAESILATLPHLREEAVIHLSLVDSLLKYFDERRAQMNSAQNPFSALYTFDEYGQLKYANEGLAKLSEIISRDALTNRPTYTPEQLYNILEGMGYGRFMEYDGSGNKIDKSEEGWEVTAIQAFWDKIDTDKEEMQSLHDSINEHMLAVLENLAAANELLKEIEDNLIAVEDRLMKAEEDRRKREIDELLKQRDAIEKSAKAVIDGLSDLLEKERDMYNRQESQDELSSLLRQLAILQRSGGSGAQIASLLKEISAKQQDAYFEAQLAQIDALLEASDNELERLDRLIELMTETLEYEKENGLLWIQISEIMQGSPEEIAAYIFENDSSLWGESPTKNEQSFREALFDAEQYTTYRDLMVGGLNKWINDFSDSSIKEAAKLDTISDLISDVKSAIASLAGSSSSGSDSSSGGGGGSGGNGNTTPTAPKASVKHYYHVKDSDYKEYSKWNTEAEAQRALNGYKQAMPAKQFIIEYYKHGGLVDYTGPAWVDGSKSHPESVLTAEQTAILRNDILSNKPTSLLSLLTDFRDAYNSIPGASAYDTINNNNSGLTIEQATVEMHVSKIANDYDAQRAGELALEKMLQIARKTSGLRIGR